MVAAPLRSSEAQIRPAIQQVQALLTSSSEDLLLVLTCKRCGLQDSRENDYVVRQRKAYALQIKDMRDWLSISEEEPQLFQLLLGRQ